MKLTKAKKRILTFLQTGPNGRHERNFTGSQIGSLRCLEERGMTGRNVNGVWRITPAGRAALEEADNGK